MRRVEDFLAEKLTEDDFAEAFWAAESDQNIAQQIEAVRALRALRLADLLSLPHAQTSHATAVLVFLVRTPVRSAN